MSSNVPRIDAAAAVPPPAREGNRRYMVLRTFPAGALDGVDAQAKAKVNAGNATVDVNWVYSYVNPDKTRTFCIYEGPDEAAVHAAAAKNGLPIDQVIEIPFVLTAR